VRRQGPRTHGEQESTVSQAQGVSPQDVSVVIQGPTGPHTADVIASARRWLPGAQVVLSTWAGSGADPTAVDVLVESDDPGSVPYWPGNTRQFNTNRLMRSSRAGVEASDRPYVLKLRTDTPLTGHGFLAWFGAFPERFEGLHVFRQRVLTLAVATRPSALAAYLFHPSDCVHFGLREDIEHLWCGPEVDETANATYWTQPAHRKHAPAAGPDLALWNEQLIWLSALRRAGYDVDYPFFRHLRPGLVAQSDLALVNNFVVLEEWQFGVALAKLTPVVRACDLGTYLWFEDWLALYESHRTAAAA
jgi:hypothetical protein